MHDVVLIIKLTSEYFFSRNVLVSLLRAVPQLEADMRVGRVYCLFSPVCLLLNPYQVIHGKV